jgi:cyclophilin family peptidyl-prolyl cis-trans isomerase/protein-disulfide isomerase
MQTNTQTWYNPTLNHHYYHIYLIYLNIIQQKREETMKKRIILIFLLSVFLFAACNQAGTPSQAEEQEATALVEEQVPVEPSEESAGIPDEPYTNAETPCKPFNIFTQQFGSPALGLPPITDDDLVIGPENPTVTFIEYSQLTCPACASFEPLLVAIQEQYPEDVRLVYRHFLFQDKAEITAQALEAAAKQGKFSEFKNYMFDRKSKNVENPEHVNLSDDAFWGTVAENDLDAWLEIHLAELGIETNQFFEDMYSSEIVEKIKATSEVAEVLNLNSTPTLYVNGHLWSQEVPRDFRTLSLFIQILKTQEKEYDGCPPNTIQADIDYSATISTTKGDFIVDLFEEIAPVTVNSFIFLAQEGWYENLPFFVTTDLALSGDHSDTTYGGPGYAFLDEFNDDQSLNDIGKLATYSLAPGINGSAFIINKSTQENQRDLTIFGEVTEGMEVVNALELRENIFSPAIDRILKVTINEK